MLGLAVTLSICGIVSWLAGRLIRAAMPERSRASAFGLGGLAGLGTLALCMFLASSAGWKWTWPAGIGLWLVAVAILSAKLKGGTFRGPLDWKETDFLVLIPLGFFLFVGIVATLAPSLTSDWDTIAYHLAVPKIWLEEGTIRPISFIHHSFFPGSVDTLFLLGLSYGGQAGAKAFTLAIFVLGFLAVYGLAKDRYGKRAAGWAAAAFVVMPVAVWETGTGYIDVAHGLFAGLGAWLVFEGFEQRGGEQRFRFSPDVLVGGILLGLAAGSKYTGLQALIGVGVVCLVLAVRGVRGKGVVVAACLSVAICAPWYLRNAVVAGNPVYPFFYERFGGKWWNQTQADVYKNEQKSFGVAFDGPLSIPAAIVGLSYQPGRYINPGQTLRITDGVPSGATGNPLGAVGAPILATLLLALLYWRNLGKSTVVAEPATLAWTVFGLLMWVFLSQQSRYMLSFAPPICMMLGGLVTATKTPAWIGRALASLVFVQGVVTAFLSFDQLLSPGKVRAAFGATEPTEYLRGGLPFYDACEYLNLVKAKRVALFDEVFGFYLDVPYFWAGYGHTNEMNYEGLKTGDDFVAQLNQLGVDRVYVNLRFNDPSFNDRWIRTMGFSNQDGPRIEADEAEVLRSDVQARWKILMAEAVLNGKLKLEKLAGGGPIFSVSP